jgi:hypothetical protein
LEAFKSITFADEIDQACSESIGAVPMEFCSRVERRNELGSRERGLSTKQFSRDGDDRDFLAAALCPRGNAFTDPSILRPAPGLVGHGMHDFVPDVSSNGVVMDEQYEGTPTRFGKQCHSLR